VWKRGKGGQWASRTRNIDIEGNQEKVTGPKNHYPWIKRRTHGFLFSISGGEESVASGGESALDEALPQEGKGRGGT